MAFLDRVQKGRVGVRASRRDQHSGWVTTSCLNQLKFNRKGIFWVSGTAAQMKVLHDTVLHLVIWSLSEVGCNFLTLNQTSCLNLSKSNRTGFWPCLVYCCSNVKVLRDVALHHVIRGLVRFVGYTTYNIPTPMFRHPCSDTQSVFYNFLSESIKIQQNGILSVYCCSMKVLHYVALQGLVRFVGCTTFIPTSICSHNPKSLCQFLTLASCSDVLTSNRLWFCPCLVLLLKWKSCTRRC